MPIQYWEFANHAVAAKWIDDGTPMPAVLEIEDQHNGKDVREIRDRLFADVIGKENLKKVYLPEKLQRIGASAFEGCQNLTTVTPSKETHHCSLPESLCEVGERAFADTSLAGGAMTILGKFLTIEKEAFRNCQFTRIVVASETLSIGERSFQSCSNLELVIGNPRIAVAEEGFSYCSNLKIMSLPISSVGDRGFYGCAKLEVLKPVGKKPRIGKEAFYGCSALNIPEGWKEEGGKK